jgi:hypothetical protein
VLSLDVSFGVVQSSFEASTCTLKCKITALIGTKVLAMSSRVNAVQMFPMTIEVSWLCTDVVAQIAFKRWIVDLGMASRLISALWFRVAFN